MATFTSYAQTRQKEDVQDDIHMISPVDTPGVSMSASTSATGKIHEWTQDTLPVVAKNAKVEGAESSSSTRTPLSPLQNYCQIMDDEVKVAATLEAVDKYGRDSDLARELTKSYMWLANVEEATVFGNPGGSGRQTGTPGDESTAREMKSIYSQLHADVIKYATDDYTSGGTAITTIEELEDVLLEAHLACYLAGGNPSYALTDPATADYFAGFAKSAGRTRDITDTTVVNVIDLYVSTYGQLDVVLDRNMVQTSRAILLMDFNYMDVPVLRATDDWPLAKGGDYERRQVLRESTCAVLNTKAHALIDAVPTTLISAADAS